LSAEHQPAWSSGEQPKGQPGLDSVSHSPDASALVNRDELQRFFTPLFRDADENSIVSLRTFPHDRGKPPLSIEGIKVRDPHLIDKIEAAAIRAARASASAVLASPVATFYNPTRATHSDLTNGLAIAVDIDKGDIDENLKKLEYLIGPATVVVRSGGSWTDPATGKDFAKRHVYWRLSEPTNDIASHNLLMLARHDAALLVGADLSGASPVHPFRWPGSVHTKDPAHPVPCRIERINEQAEVHLEEAAEKLSEAVHAPGLGSRRGEGQDRAKDQQPPAELSDLASALAAIPVEGMAHFEWIVIGMALHNATAGSDAGLELFDKFSRRSPGDYDRKGLEAQWRSFAKKPHAKRLRTAGTIYYLAQRHGWRFPPRAPEPTPDPPPSGDEEATDQKPRADGQQSADETHTSKADNPDPTMKSDGNTRETAHRLPNGILKPQTAITFFNSKYMLVKEAGKAVIFEPLVDPMLQRRCFDRLHIADFKALYANRDVSLGHDGEGKPIIKRAAEFWLRHPKRRQYLGGVVFRPGRTVAADALNLWDGFAITPQPGCCQRLYDHIRDVICHGDAALFSWLINWIARMLQHPAERAEVCVVIRGTEEGSGKSTLGRVLMRLLGQHAFAITDPRHLIGGFNAHLRDCVFLLGDEAFYAGDKAHVGILKTIITEPTLTIEGKFRDAILVPNFLHVMLTANAEWVVPASLSARRFLVLDASPRHVGDQEYFRALWVELDAGGLAAFLHDMLHRDLSQFNWREPPDTAGLQEQKKRSLTNELAWWMDVLHRGYVWRSKLGLEGYFAKWHDTVTTELLFASYLEFVKGRHERFPLSRETVGKFLRKFGEPANIRNAVVGEHLIDASTDNGVRREAHPDTRERAHGYRFGSLKEARCAFTSHTGLTIEWEPADDLFPDA
jgi:hypothetical protein